MKRYLLVIQRGLSRMLQVFHIPSSSYTFSAPQNIQYMMARYCIVGITVLLLSASATAQKSAGEDTAYTRVINERAAKIVTTLDIAKKNKQEKVQAIIADQYRQLNTIHENSKVIVTEIKKNNSLSKGAIDTVVKTEDDKKMELLKKQHTVFLGQLKKQLTEEQLEKVKDGMTYRVLPITYTAYQDMILTLTDKQKKQIYDWLLEAREYAMDAESSDKKHWWFGKYKGRINNYLSAEGYDLKKANEDWARRRNEAKTTPGK